MSFLTEYFDEYRQHPIRKTQISTVGDNTDFQSNELVEELLSILLRNSLPTPRVASSYGQIITDYRCRPENRWAELEGQWLDPKVGTQDKQWTDDEVKEFIKTTMKSIRGQSGYYNDYCSHLDQIFKYRVFKPRVKKLRPCSELLEKKVTEEEPPPAVEAPKLAMKDTVLMKMAAQLYEQDLSKPTLQPLKTHFRTLGYCRPYLWHTGISDYQHSIARLAYEMIRDDRIPRYHAHNGCRPRWGLPPEGVRQPELDGAPYDGERLY